MLQATPVEKKILDLTILKKVVLYLYLFLFPLLFLPLTQEFFFTTKFYLTWLVATLLLLFSTVEFLVEKKIRLSTSTFETLLTLVILSSLLSTLIVSPNKVQAALSFNFGPVVLASFAVIFYYLFSLRVNPWPYLTLSAGVLSLLAIIFFFNPLAKASLPQDLQFALTTPYFTPAGAYLDLLLFLGFVGAGTAIQLLQEKEKKSLKLGLFFIIAVGFFLSVYNVIKPQVVNGQAFRILLPPFRLSWYAAVEILKSPLNAIFGAGIDNYSFLFTRVKDVAYNQSDLWQISFFNFGRNVFLHVLTVAGLVGLTSLVLFFLKLAKEVRTEKTKLYLVGLLVALFIISPPSLFVWFLFFTTSAWLVKSRKFVQFDASQFAPAFIGTLILSLAIVSASSYFLARTYAAEVYFKKALDGLAQNNATIVYEGHRQAIQLNPYIERFRISFSQVNLLLANNLTQQILDEQKKEKPDQERINNLRQNITQAVQAAINEAKAAVALNSQKASNWANLAAVYQNILNLAQNADVWTISSYQRAILLDPQNPIYRLNLGGVYFSLNQFDQALRLFEQAVALKPDWANAYYNLAWAAYNTQDYQRAVLEMQNVLNLLDPKQAKADYERAQKDLEEFKKKLEETGQATGSATTPTPTPTPSQLSLPTPAPTIEEKIQLPKEASPEAR